MFNLMDRRLNIVARKVSSATVLIMKPTVWKGSRVRSDLKGYHYFAYVYNVVYRNGKLQWPKIVQSQQVVF